MADTYINEMTGATETILLDAWVDTWHLVESDIGLVYAQIVEWKRAFGRVDWLVRTLGDEHKATTWVWASRFVRREDPPIREKPGNQNGRRERTLSPTKRTHDHAGQPRVEGLRNPDDPIAAELAAEGQSTGVRKRKRKRRATTTGR